MRSINPLAFRVEVSTLEAESIFQRADKINRDMEAMEMAKEFKKQKRKHSHPRFHAHSDANELPLGIQ